MQSVIDIAIVGMNHGIRVLAAKSACCCATPFAPEDTLCVCVYKQKWQQIGLSVKLTQTTDDKNVLGQGTEASASPLDMKAFCSSSAGNVAEGASKGFRSFFFEDQVTIHRLCRRLFPRSHERV